MRFLRQGGPVFGVLFIAFIPGCGSSEPDEPLHAGVAQLSYADRLDRGEEEVVLSLISSLKTGDHYARTRAEQELAARGSKVVPYVALLLDEPDWDVKAVSLRLIVKHGSGSPSAVKTLVKVLGDASVPDAVRQDAARALAGWTGQEIPYDAWGPPGGVESAAAAWRAWYEKEHGEAP